MGLVGYTVSNLENGLWYGINSLDPDEVIPYQTPKTVLGTVSSAVISFREYRITPQKPLWYGISPPHIYITRK